MLDNFTFDIFFWKLDIFWHFDTYNLNHLSSSQGYFLPFASVNSPKQSLF